MLREIKAVKQEPGRARKQWFSDEVMDLFVWRGGDGKVEKFQLVARIAGGEGASRERALTWSEAAGFHRHLVDDGERRPDRYKATPILIPTKDLPLLELSQVFGERAGNLDSYIRGFVADKLDELRSQSGPDKACLGRPTDE